MKLAFAISLIFALTSFATVLDEAVATPDVPKVEGKPPADYAPMLEAVVAFADIPAKEGSPKYYDPCYYNPPNAAACGSLCSSCGYSGGLCISYACYCLLY